MENFYGFIIYLLFEAVKYAFPFEVFWHIVSGEGDATDICRVLFLPSIFTYLTTKRGWIKGCCIFILFFGLFLNSDMFLIHVIATVIWFICVYFGIRVFNVMSARFRKHNE